MATTIVEFLAPLKGSGRREAVLAAMFYARTYESADLLAIEDLRELLKRARVQGANNMNVSDVLAKAGEYVDSPGIVDGRRVWRLTETGLAHVREILNIPRAEPQVEHDVASLATIQSTITDADVKDYVGESIKCLSFGALRACVVFLWAGAVRTLENQILQRPLADVNAALGKHDSKARQVKSIDDFAYVKEHHLLLVAQDVGVLDKGQREMLGQALDLRNRCGHPGKYSPGPQRVAAFVEDVLRIVFGAK